MKQSAPSSKRPLLPLESFVFFVDRSLGGKIVPQALAARGWTIKRHDDFFEQDTADAAWIFETGKRGWIILTADNRIRYNPLEKEALRRCGTWTFILASKKNLQGLEMAQAFLRAEKAIQKALTTQPAPGVFRVHVEGQISKCFL